MSDVQRSREDDGSTWDHDGGERGVVGEAGESAQGNHHTKQHEPNIGSFAQQVFGYVLD